MIIRLWIIDHRCTEFSATALLICVVQVMLLCPETYIYCVQLTILQYNANNGRTAINYSRLLTKLKVELPDTNPKKPRNGKKFYPTEVQRRLLDVCEYKNFLNPPGFDNVREVNQFVTEYAQYQKDFEKIHGDSPCLSMQLMFRIHSLFRTLLYHVLLFFV